MLLSFSASVSIIPVIGEGYDKQYTILKQDENSVVGKWKQFV